ncbi:MAG: hypothetical protein ACREDA_06145 [Methylocella sp.]
MTDLENAVLEKLLAGNSDTFRILYQQYQEIDVIKREMTGVGFYTYFSKAKVAPPLPGEPSFHFSDVHAELKGLEGGAGFLLTINKGYLYDLEGYCYEGAWPENIEIISISYVDGPQRNEAEVLNSVDRCNPLD